MARLYFDLARLDPWFREEMEQRLAPAIAHAGATTVVAEAAAADFVISLHGHSVGDPLPRPASRAGRSVVWHGGDHPSGWEPGLYCSLPARLFSPARHRTFCYPIRYNEQIRAYDPGDARRLFTFVGGITARLGRTLVDVLQQASALGECRIRGANWESVFDRSGIEAKVTYAESLRRAKFVLCPRGNGVGTIRLFEAMEARRVPVILSDAYVLPKGVDWERCAIVVKERDVARVVDILRSRESEWREMADAARAAWESAFAPAVLLDEMGRALKELDLGRNPAEPAIRRAQLRYRLGQWIRRLLQPLRAA